MRYFLLSLGVLLLIIFGIVIFTRSSGTSPTKVTGSVNLASYATNNNGEVQYTVDGPINAPENHRAIRITVSPSSRTLDIISGYQGSVTTTQTYPNDTNSYSNFLAALGRASFTRNRRAVTNDYLSICPLNSRSTYQVINGGEDALKTWSAPCAVGSFGGNIPLTNSLFQAQIPNYATLTNNVNVGGTTTITLF